MTKAKKGMKFQNTLLLSIYLSLSIIFVSSCNKNLSEIENIQDQFVSGGLNVTMLLDHYPALNEEATIYLQSSFQVYIRDSLAALGVDSVQLYNTLGVQEDHKPASDAFNVHPIPDSLGMIDSLFASIYDTTNWEFTIKAIQVGEFSFGVHIGSFPGYKAIEDSVIRNLVGLAFGWDGIIVCIEENRGYDCSPWNR